jgi:hypothetical protein
MELTLLERIGLDGLIRQQKGSIGELETLIDIRRKLAITQEILSEVIVPVPGGAMVNKDAVDSAPLMEIAFEKEERRRVTTLLTNHTDFGIDDFAWASTLKSKMAL